jgi:hypothetical protein
MEVLYAHHRLPRGHRPPMTSSPMPAARCPHLLDLLAQVPDPRKKRGRRHALAGLLAAGIAAVIAGSRSFAAIGQWAGEAGPDVLAALGADCGAAEESTYRRAFALVSADVLRPATPPPRPRPVPGPEPADRAQEHREHPLQTQTPGQPRHPHRGRTRIVHPAAAIAWPADLQPGRLTQPSR